ncbi:hypothetical protein [Mycolicibacterium hodleri]
MHNGAGHWTGFAARHQVVHRGSRPMLGVPGEPWPRCASTAHWETRRTRQAAVIVRTSQPTREAIVARVTATWRPVAWSACSAITAAIDNSVVE